MSTAADSFAALGAAVAASRDPYVAGSAAAEAPGPSRHDQGLRGIDIAAVNLLWRVRRALPAASPQCVQFSPCTGPYTGDEIVYGFARAAAIILGRTLLINARETLSAGILPDAFVPRLYHQCMDGPALLDVLSHRAGIVGPAAMFNLIVIDQHSPLASDGACMAAPFCLGTVLVVKAGATRLSSIQAASSRISAAGGAILGTVLTGTPAWALRG